MFVCDDCHDPRCNHSLEDLLRSYGRCEECGNTSNCRDCQGYKSLPPRTVIMEEPDGS